MQVNQTIPVAFRMFGQGVFLSEEEHVLVYLRQNDDGALSRREVSSDVIVKNNREQGAERLFILHQAAALALGDALNFALREHGKAPTIISGYRDVRQQRRCFLSRLRASGNFFRTIRRVAPPGLSDQYTGLAIDLAQELKLAAHCLPLFGWEPSFLPDNAASIPAEAWHWRYLGSPVISRQLQRTDLTLVEREQVKANFRRFAEDDFSAWFRPEPDRLDALGHTDALRHLLIELDLLDEHDDASLSAHTVVRAAMQHIALEYAAVQDLVDLCTVLEAECLLCKGDSGPRVRRLQEGLRFFGYLAVPATGAYGVATVEAVMRFQRAAGLAPSGIADVATLASLRRARKNLFSLVDANLFAELAKGEWGGPPPSKRLNWLRLQPSNSALTYLVPVVREQTITEHFADPARHGHILCDEALAAAIPPHVSYLRVDRSIRGLARLARHARRQLRGKVIAITGSSGKTTTKEMLRAALLGQGLTHASGGSANSTNAICQGLINAPLAADWLIYESGLGAGGSSIREHSDLLRPDVAIVTAVHTAHAEGYASLEEIARRKIEIAARLCPHGVLLLDADAEFFPLFEEIASALGVKRLLTFGASEKAAVRVLEHQVSLDGTRVELALQGSRYTATIPMIGAHWATMLAATAGACAALNVDIERALADLGKLVVPPGRGGLIPISAAGGKIIVFDSHYNANPGSMAADLQAFRQLAERYPELRKVAVIGEYKELGALSTEAHHQLGGLLSEAGFERVFLIGGNHAETLQTFASAAVNVFENVAEALPSIRDACVAGDLVFIKGSHSNNLVEVVSALKRRAALQQ